MGQVPSVIPTAVAQQIAVEIGIEFFLGFGHKNVSVHGSLTHRGNRNGLPYGHGTIDHTYLFAEVVGDLWTLVETKTTFLRAAGPCISTYSHVVPVKPRRAKWLGSQPDQSEPSRGYPNLTEP